MSWLLFLSALLAAAQRYPIIGADNIAGLKPAQRIDFVDFVDISDDLAIGWFEASDDASEFIVIGDSGSLYRISGLGGAESWSYRQSEDQVFSLIDAVYWQGDPYLLYLLDGEFYINEWRLSAEGIPVGLYVFDDSLFVEAREEGSLAVFQAFAIDDEARVLQFGRTAALPGPESDAPAARIGRIDFPLVIMSYLSEGGLTVYRFPASFSAERGRSFELAGGPAVFGAVNAAGSHLAWSDPASARLNLLDLASGENAIVAELDGAYAQYHLLTAEAGAILIVNMDFKPAVFAWDSATGQRYDLGLYRECARIPDKVALSRDGRALIIGCDAGLEIWRIEANEEA